MIVSLMECKTQTPYKIMDEKPVCVFIPKNILITVG